MTTILSDDLSPSLFRNSPHISIIRSVRTFRRHLLMIRSGSEPRPWLFDKEPADERNFDIAINYYAEPNPEDQLLNCAEYLVAGGLSKYHAAKQFLYAGYLDKYDGVCFLDEDVELHYNPSEFFDYCYNRNFSIAQASLTSVSDGAWKITFNHPGFEYRLTNFVEVMAPWFSKVFLMTVVDAFDISISTYGLDVFWGCQLEEGQTAGVVDRYQMSHLKSRNLHEGAYYSYLKSIGVDWLVEMKEVLKSLGLDRYDIRLKGGVEIIESVRVGLANG